MSNVNLHGLDTSNALRKSWEPIEVDSAGNLKVGNVGFKPSNYDADLTMDATGEAAALASGVKNIYVVNRGATTEAVRVAFGTSSANALANLTIVTNAATTGYYIGAAADGFKPEAVIGVPANATHYAVGPAVAGDAQTVSVTQGV